MNDCLEIRNLLVLYAEAALGEAEAHRVGAHLAACSSCRSVAREIMQVRQWLADPELFSPAEDMEWQLLPGKLAERARAPHAAKTGLFGLSGRQWAWSAAALLAVAFGVFEAVRIQTPVPAEAPMVVSASDNGAFLDRMRAVHALSATADYLAGCRDLLINLVSAGRSCEGDLYDVSFEVSRARQLLLEKRMLDADLGIPEVERTRGLCDDLEHFLVSLSSSRECETKDTLRSMERYIEDEQLLLRINVAQAGIS